MDKVYRRENTKRNKRERISGREFFSVKTFFVKQCMVCGVIFAACCVLKTSPADNMMFQKNCVKYIFSHNTVVAEFPQTAKDFIDKYIFDKSAEQKRGKDALLNMVAPIESTIESPFGMRTHPIENVKKFHYGVDLKAEEGTKVLCAGRGRAKEVSQNSEYGKYIIVEHGDNITTLYAHLSNILASVDDEIEAGQMIAESGSTGNVTGPHLHFELRDDEEWLDPAEFIKFPAKEE
ncbi:MAG: M23 family metallopeptidase [Clostridia bacterium]|nr:M23 family metallopeptidase [Clostridia bacterium]